MPKSQGTLCLRCSESSFLPQLVLTLTAHWLSGFSRYHETFREAQNYIRGSAKDDIKQWTKTIDNYWQLYQEHDNPRHQRTEAAGNAENGHHLSLTLTQGDWPICGWMNGQWTNALSTAFVASEFPLVEFWGEFRSRKILLNFWIFNCDVDSDSQNKSSCSVI